jgi:hypothetical protein
MNKIFILLGLTFVGFWIIFLSLQKPIIYANSLGIIAKNWQNRNGERKLVAQPYESLKDDNYIQWDGKHYYLIRNDGYNIEKAGGDYIFAFFPLFPLIWKMSHLPPVGILFLNYVFFSISILILLRIFSDCKYYFLNALLSLCFPILVVFLIPYTEAIYMLIISIGIYGFIKDKYWIYSTAFILAAITRPSFTIILLSIISVESFYFIRHRNIWLLLKKIFLMALPLLLGTMIVSLVQLTQNSGSLFKFIEVQKYWEHVFSLPHHLRDWSHESFAINIGVVFIIFIPLLTIIVMLLYTQFNKAKKREVLDYKNAKDYLLLLSIVYLIGNTLLVILFQGGSLHNLFRYTLCSPFFFVLLYSAFDYIRDISINFRFFIICTLSLLSLFIVGLADYSNRWNFSDFGIFVFISALSFWIFQDFGSSRFYKIGSFFLLLLNIVWTTYLFNIYIINGWIFA